MVYIKKGLLALFISYFLFIAQLPVFGSGIQQNFSAPAFQTKAQSAARVAAIPLTGIADTTILTYSGQGTLYAVGIIVTTAPTGTPTAALRINGDSLGAQSILSFPGGSILAAPYNAASEFPSATAPGIIGLSGKCSISLSCGTSINDIVVTYVGVNFQTSILVDFNVTGTGTAGVVTIWALYAAK